MPIFYPTEDRIKTAGPQPGMFYRRANTAATTVAHIAQVASRNSSVSVTTFEMVQLIANSPWNQAHIEFGMKGYENYGFAGPQYKAIYSKDPTSSPNTGSDWPTLWIPTVDGKEPAQVFGQTSPDPGPGPDSNGGNGPAPVKAGFPWWIVAAGGVMLVVLKLFKTKKPRRKKSRNRRR